MSPDDIAAARQIVRRRFPQARAAWLGGSVAAGTATDTSDLDITVLLDGPPAPFRESMLLDGRPVELFVQTEESLMRFCEKDIQRRRPTTMRLVGASIVLVDSDGVAVRVQQHLDALDHAGPPAASPEELETARYLVTDYLDDLGGPRDGEALVIASGLWTATAELLLLANQRWSGSGKWLLRELRSLDAACGTTYAERLVGGFTAAAGGDLKPLRHTAGAILGLCGGRLFDGYLRGAPDSPKPRRHNTTGSVVLRLRHAGAHDIEFCFALRKAAMGGYISEAWGWDEDDQRAVHERDFGRGRYQIVCIGGRPVGVLDVEPRDTVLHLRRIDLLPEFCNHGIGTSLLRDLLDRARHDGRGVTLNVLVVNRRAEQLYHRLGFVVTARLGQAPGELITMAWQSDASYLPPSDGSG
ncbi:MAG: GNAT family N-acetyltransferase [Mycobacterium sp.]